MASSSTVGAFPKSSPLSVRTEPPVPRRSRDEFDIYAVPTPVKDEDVCRYFGLKKGCRGGSKCNYLHLHPNTGDIRESKYLLRMAKPMIHRSITNAFRMFLSSHFTLPMEAWLGVRWTVAIDNAGNTRPGRSQNRFNPSGHDLPQEVRDLIHECLGSLVLKECCKVLNSRIRGKGSNVGLTIEFNMLGRRPSDLAVQHMTAKRCGIALPNGEFPLDRQQALQETERASNGAMIMYHGTETEAGVQILKDGYIRNSGPPCSPPGVYLTPNPSENLYYHRGAVFMVGVHGFPLTRRHSKDLRDTNQNAPEGTFCYFTEKSVPHEVCADTLTTELLSVRFEYNALAAHIHSVMPSLANSFPRLT